jgi:hypothetical protein
MAIAASQIRTVPAYVESGQIIDVDVEAYSVSAVTQFTKKPLSGLGFATPYQHHANGEGIYFMPEVGSLCWICFPSDGSKPFVLAWAPARDENDSLRSKKMGLNPGDIYLGTRDENFLILRRGGVVQIGGGPLSQRMFIPINNAIRDFCENYTLNTLGGDLDWSIQRSENTTDGARPATLKLRAKQFADDPDYVAVLEIGSHSDSSQNILSLVINASGKTGAATKISLEFQKDGSVSWSCEGNVDWSVRGNFSLAAQGNVSVSSSLAASIQGRTVDVQADAAASVKAGTTLSLLAGGQVTAGPMLVVGEGTFPVLLADPAFLTWLLTHVHPVIGPGSPTGPPAPPSNNLPVSTTLFGS